MITTFENAKVGDMVWHLEKGWGVISYIGKGVYPIVVDFDSRTRQKSFTYAGKSYNSTRAIQFLFWDEVEIVAPSKPLPELPVDTKVYVWNNREDNVPLIKVPRHFCRFDESGNAECYLEGQTSWTTDGGDCILGKLGNSRINYIKGNYNEIRKV